MKLTRIQYDWVRIHENRKCSRCGNDRDTKLQTCFTCTQSERIRKLKYANDRKAKGLCPRCGTIAKDGFFSCNRNSCIPSRKIRL